MFIKFLEVNKEEYLYTLRIGKDTLNKTKAINHKEESETLLFINYTGWGKIGAPFITRGCSSFDLLYKTEISF